ncbi:hypothetical protein MRB53_042127 [Persea americana]|nr:hypothetical protein MRB53_042127 [Persea americana]
MAKVPLLGDLFLIAFVVTVLEAFGIIYFAPQLRPSGSIAWLWVPALVLNLFIALLYKCYIYPDLLSPLRHLPGPGLGSPFIGHVVKQFSNPPGEHMRPWIDDMPNDGIIRVRGMLGNEELIITSPELLKTVLSDNSYDYEKPREITDILRRLLGNGLILAEGSLHKFQRKHLMPSFQLKNIRDLYPLFWTKACELTNDIRPAEQAEKAGAEGFVVDFGDWSMRATLDIIGYVYNLSSTTLADIYSVAGLGRDFGALKDPKAELVVSYNEILEPGGEKALWFAMNSECAMSCVAEFTNRASIPAVLVCGNATMASEQALHQDTELPLQLCLRDGTRSPRPPSCRERSGWNGYPQSTREKQRLLRP